MIWVWVCVCKGIGGAGSGTAVAAMQLPSQGGNAPQDAGYVSVTRTMLGDTLSFPSELLV